MAKIAKLQPLTDECITAGVKMLGDHESAALSEHEFYKKVDASSLDLVNIETDEGDVQLGRIADAYLVENLGEGALVFINDESKAGKAEYDPWEGQYTAGVEGDKISKTKLQGRRRSYKRTLKKKIIKHLSGRVKPEGRRKKSVFERTVGKIRPEMNTIRSITAPTQAQMDLLMMLRKVDELCSSCDPAAKIVSRDLTKKAAKGNVKKK